MKKTLALILVIASLFAAMTAFADTQGFTLREGRYIVGQEIPAGLCTLTCTETVGEQVSDAYGSLGDALDALDGTSGYGSLFGALGGMMAEVATMTVEIVGDYGDVLKSYSMKTGESILLTLETGTALKISDGACTYQMGQ